MMNETVISLDTNIVVVGLQLANSPEERLLDNVYRFQVKLAQQVEVELRRNLTPKEQKRFYKMVYADIGLEIAYGQPPVAYVERYQKLGLKKGDVLIAAFCEWQEIDLFVSRNRHFLKQLPDPPFEVIDAVEFGQRFLD